MTSCTCSHKLPTQPIRQIITDLRLDQTSDRGTSYIAAQEAARAFQQSVAATIMPTAAPGGALTLQMWGTAYARRLPVNINEGISEKLGLTEYSPAFRGMRFTRGGAKASTH